MTEREAVGLLFEAYYLRRPLTPAESYELELALPPATFMVRNPDDDIADVPETLRAMREFYVHVRL